MNNKILKSLPLCIRKRYIKKEIINALKKLEEVMYCAEALSKSQLSWLELREIKIQLLNMRDYLSMKKFKPGCGYWLLDGGYDPKEEFLDILFDLYYHYKNTLP